MAEDFSGQTLRGRSFVGQDLTGANFAQADLRGANFTNAQLVGANLSQARMGLTRLWRGLLLAGAAILALLSGGLSYVFACLMEYLLLPETRAVTGAIPVGLTGTVLLWLGLLVLRQGFTGLDRRLMQGVVVGLVLATMLLGSQPIWGGTIAVGTLAVVVAVAIVKGIGILVAGTELVRGEGFGAAVGAVALMTAVGVTSTTLCPIDWPLAIVSLGIYVAWRSRSDSLYATIYQTTVEAIAPLGTTFRGANLTDADLTQARLKLADFRAATLHRTRFYLATRSEQARWGESILRQPDVRTLLVTGQAEGRSLAGMDLQGANLRAMDLTGCNLRAANLRGTDLQGANLTGSNLTLVDGVGADFRLATLTGACVDLWDIDRTTQLEGIRCLYLYTGSGTDRQRLPQQGDWPVGEFTRRFHQTEVDQVSLFDTLPPKDSTINPAEVLASLLILMRMAIADDHLETVEREMLAEAIQALNLPEDVTVDRLLDERVSVESLLQQIHSPVIKEQVYQSAYVMARIDGELSITERELLQQLATGLELPSGKVEKLQQLVPDITKFSIAAQLDAITDPEKREAAIDTNIRLMAVMHGFSGALPTPGFAIVSHLMIYKDQVELVQKIARLWGYPANYQSPELERALFGSVGATAARVALSNVVLFVPLWGSVINASTAFSMTWAIGTLAKQYFAEGCQMDEAALRAAFASMKNAGRELFEDWHTTIATQQQQLLPKIQAWQAALQAGTLKPQDYWQHLQQIQQHP